MTRKQKQELFDAITEIGYKETEILLLKFIDGEVVPPTTSLQIILAWFNLWYNKGEFQSDTHSVVSFIQTNTFSNPKNNNRKKVYKPENDPEFIKIWTERFGPPKL